MLHSALLHGGGELLMGVAETVSEFVVEDSDGTIWQ